MEAFRTVEAIYFDLDDTLCAYWDASKAALRAAFEGFGPPGVPVETMFAHWAETFRRFSPTVKDSDWYKNYLKFGEPTRVEQMRLALAEAGVDDPALAKALSDAYALERDRRLALFPDALKTLEWLFKRYPLGLITNGPADIQRQEIVTLGIERFFRHILIEGEMGEGKPSPAVFLRAERLMEKEPGQILFVGNSYKHDIVPAIEAGWRTAWIRRASDVPPSANGNEPEERPADGVIPDVEIGALSELPPMLRSGA